MEIDKSGDKNFQSFCLDLKNNIHSQFEIAWPNVEKILSNFSGIKNYSHGQLSFYFMKLCFSIIILNKSKFDKVAIFLDEPDNYLHPKFIQEFIDEIVELNIKNKSEIFITSHNYYFISELINNIQLDPDELKILKIERTAEDKTITKYMDDDIKESKNCCAVRLLYDIYEVPTPDFLDYLIGESGLGFDSNGNADKCIVIQHPEFAIKDSSGNEKMIKNGGFSHHSYVNLIRN
ncbi:AAA family ATPase [bacterium]|nr:AAA family ATPase [bacterium]